MLEVIEKEIYNIHTSVLIPRIDILTCIGCERCIDQCRTGALSIKRIENWGYSSLLYPERCTGCGICADYCGEQAIEMV